MEETKKQKTKQNKTEQKKKKKKKHFNVHTQILWVHDPKAKTTHRMANGAIESPRGKIVEDHVE